MQTIPLIIVAAYLIGMLLIGFIVGKLNIKDSDDYMLAGRRMGLFMVAFSLSANNIGGGSTTGLAQKAFGEWGMSAIWYVLAAIWLEVRQNRDRTPNTAVNVLENLPKRRPTTSGIVTAIVLRIFGAK